MVIDDAHQKDEPVSLVDFLVADQDAQSIGAVRVKTTAFSADVIESFSGQVVAEIADNVEIAMPFIFDVVLKRFAPCRDGIDRGAAGHDHREQEDAEDVATRGNHRS